MKTRSSHSSRAATASSSATSIRTASQARWRTISTARKLGGNDPEVAKLALFVRTGKLTRAEALERMEALDSSEAEANLDRFLETTGLTQSEFEESRDLSPAPYLTGIPRLFNEVRKRVRRQMA